MRPRQVEERKVPHPVEMDSIHVHHRSCQRRDILERKPRCHEQVARRPRVVKDEISMQRCHRAEVEILRLERRGDLAVVQVSDHVAHPDVSRDVVSGSVGMPSIQKPILDRKAV